MKILIFTITEDLSTTDQNIGRLIEYKVTVKLTVMKIFCGTCSLGNTIKLYLINCFLTCNLLNLMFIFRV